MRYPTSYSTKQQLALLQTYIAMMDGEIMNLDYFNELTGCSRDYYKVVMPTLNEMIHDLDLKCSLQKISQEIVTDETRYKKFSYKLLSRFDYSFKMNKDLSDDKKIMYSSVIIFLQLKKGYYVSWDILSNYFPHFTNRDFIKVIDGIKKNVADEIIKNELQSYEMNNID